jgi:hypothetical protein
MVTSPELLALTEALAEALEALVVALLPPRLSLPAGFAEEGVAGRGTARQLIAGMTVFLQLGGGKRGKEGKKIGGTRLEWDDESREGCKKRIASPQLETALCSAQ